MDAQTWELFCPALHFAIYVFGCVWLQWYISQHKTIIWTKQHRYEYLRSDTVLKIIDEARTFSLDLWINFVGITLHNMCPLHQMPNSISPPPIQTWINITPPLSPFLWTILPFKAKGGIQWFSETSYGVFILVGKFSSRMFIYVGTACVCSIKVKS